MRDISNDSFYKIIDKDFLACKNRRRQLFISLETVGKSFYNFQFSRELARNTSILNRCLKRYLKFKADVDCGRSRQSWLLCCMFGVELNLIKW